MAAKGPLVGLRIVKFSVLNRLNFLPRLLRILVMTHTHYVPSDSSLPAYSGQLKGIKLCKIYSLEVL